MKERNEFILKQIQECIGKPRILRMLLHSRAGTDLKRWCNWSLSPKTGFNDSLEENERNWITRIFGQVWRWKVWPEKSTSTAPLGKCPLIILDCHQITNIVLLNTFRFINLALLDGSQHLWRGFLHVVKDPTDIPCLNHREKLDKKWLRFLSLHLCPSLTFKNYGHNFVLITIF